MSKLISYPSKFTKIFLALSLFCISAFITLPAQGGQPNIYVHNKTNYILYVDWYSRVVAAGPACGASHPHAAAERMHKNVTHNFDKNCKDVFNLGIIKKGQEGQIGNLPVGRDSENKVRTLDLKNGSEYSWTPFYKEDLAAIRKNPTSASKTTPIFEVTVQEENAYERWRVEVKKVGDKELIQTESLW